MVRAVVGLLHIGESAGGLARHIVDWAVVAVVEHGHCGLTRLSS